MDPESNGKAERQTGTERQRQRDRDTERNRTKERMPKRLSIRDFPLAWTLSDIFPTASHEGGGKWRVHLSSMFEAPVPWF